ncbi:DEAD/DEAH box helicase [Halosquirtibacter laminarini]|uniref:DEAD/DEAH box helicase n=1 Tax=Halosquirtibacter laminarini TaxID=3374600 RepID=A0AC61NC49_9BACT|nr:DEAD/DEAH box helicase [Prolixibacteraceae bacterium]
MGSNVEINKNKYASELYCYACHFMELMEVCDVELFKRCLWSLKLECEVSKNYTLAKLEHFISDLLEIKILHKDQDGCVVFSYNNWEDEVHGKLYSDSEFGVVMMKAIEKDEQLSFEGKVFVALQLCEPRFCVDFLVSGLKRDESHNVIDLYRIIENQRRIADKLFALPMLYSNEAILDELLVQIDVCSDHFQPEVISRIIELIVTYTPNKILFSLVKIHPRLTELKKLTYEERIGAPLFVGNKKYIGELIQRVGEEFNEYKLPWFDNLGSLRSVPINELNQWTNGHMNHTKKKLFVPGLRGLFIAFILVKNNDDKSIKALLSLANDGISNYKVPTYRIEAFYFLSYKFLRLYARAHQGKELNSRSAWLNLYQELEDFADIPWIIGVWVARWLGFPSLIIRIIKSNRDEIEGLKENTYIQRVLVECNEIVSTEKDSEDKIPFDFFLKDDFYTYHFLDKKEPWVKALKMIQSLSMEESKHSNSCVMWILSDFGFYMELNAYERSYGAKGLNKGRKLSFSKLNTSPPSSASIIDIEVANCYEEDRYGDMNTSCFGKMLYVLRKHPHVYSNKDYEYRIEITEYPFIVEIVKSKNIYYITGNREVEKNYSYYFDSDTNVFVTKASDIEIKFSKILVECGNCIEVPEEQWSEFQVSLKGLSTKLFIDGDPNEATVSVQESVARPMVQMCPIGDLLRVDFMIKHHDIQNYLSQIACESRDLVIEGTGRSFLVRTDQEKEIKLRREVIKAFKDTDFDFQEEDLSLTSSDILESLKLMTFVKENFPSWTMLWPEGEFFKLSNTITEKDLNVEVKSSNGWFDLSSQWQLDKDNVISLVELMKRTNNGHNRFIKLDESHYVSMSESLQKKIQKVAALGVTSTEDNESLRIHPMLMDVFDDWMDHEDVKVSSDWKKHHEKIQKIDRKNFVVSKEYKAELRSYQKEGFQWLCKLYELGLGACLADDMGLGKTIQILALLDKYKAQGPSVVVAPSSVVSNWEREISRFACALNCKILPLKNRPKFIQSLTHSDVLVISYGVLQSNTSLLESRTWNVVALDEAHAIKNNQTSRSKAVMNLEAKFRIAATGTPVQNHLGELWNLFQFLIPGLLGDYKSFQLKYLNGESVDKNRELLKRLFRPFLLRRTKGEVLTELPKKTEIVREVELSSEEKDYYEACRIMAQQNIENAEPQKARFQVLAEITRLRQACLSSALVDGEMKVDSSKLRDFETLLNTIVDGDHKVLVFSQFTGYLKMIESQVKRLGYEYCYLDGTMSKAKRNKQIQMFQEGTPKVFLISLKAGGVGLNLTAADYVIHMDPWWNPAIEDQATDRAHRMGQDKPVTVYRLITKGTIEEKIIGLHETKRNLADQILEGTDTSSTLDLEDLRSLLL